MNKIDLLAKEIEKINKILRELKLKDEIIEREVKAFGSGGHIVVPKRHLNKKAKILVGS